MVLNSLDNGDSRLQTSDYADASFDGGGKQMLDSLQSQRKKCKSRFQSIERSPALVEGP